MSINVNSVSKRFGGDWILRNIAFSAPDGSVVGIFGASGSGKSTLARIIAGKVRPDGGDIASLDGGQSDIDRRPGVTLIDSSANSTFTDIIFKRSISIASGRRETAAIEQLSLSSGDTLVLDDPFRRTDAEQFRSIAERIRSLVSARSISVVFLTSSFDQLIGLAETAHFLDNTEIFQSGTPEEFYDQPISSTLASLTGDVNLIEARRLTKSTSGVHEFHSIVGDHRIFAHAKDRSRLGPINQNVMLAIRPEQIAMSLGASFPEDNLLKAVVTAIEPRGSTSIVHFDTGGLALSTRVFRVVGLSIGDECMLGLPPSRIVVMGR